MNSSTNVIAAEMRRLATQVFTDTLAEVKIPRVFADKIEYSRGVLRVEQDLYDLSSFEQVFVVAMGKAAHTMLEALIAHTGPSLEGIVVCSFPPVSQQPGFRYFLGGHPLEGSIRAGKATLKALSDLSENTLVLYLISGGASAMIEVPYDEEISLDDVVETYRVLVHSGAAIAEINSIRKHLSAVKGGRLAQRAFPAHQVSIMVSDVPEDSLDALASGPTMPDSSTEADCYRIAETYHLLAKLPKAVRQLFEEHALEETPKADDAVFLHSRWWPILSSASAANAAASLASKSGFVAEIDNTPDDWTYDRAAEYLLGRLRELRKRAARSALVSAGEITVRVEGGGVGGRNQHFALHCAHQIAGENITILSAGTDGIDGNSSAAGAVVDGTTCERAQAMRLSAQEALETFNSFPFFQHLGDAVVTGPTGNNERHLRILLAW